MGAVCSWCGCASYRPQYKFFIQNVFKGEVDQLHAYICKYPSHASKAGLYLHKQLSKKIEIIKRKKQTSSKKSDQISLQICNEIKHGIESLNILLSSCSHAVDLRSDHFVMEIIVLFLDSGRKELHIYGMQSLRKYLRKLSESTKSSAVVDLTSVTQSVLTFLESSTDSTIKIASFQTFSVIFKYIHQNSNNMHHSFMAKFYKHFESIIHVILVHIRPTIMEYQHENSYFAIRKFSGKKYSFDENDELHFQDSTIYSVHNADLELKKSLVEALDDKTVPIKPDNVCIEMQPIANETVELHARDDNLHNNQTKNRIFMSDEHECHIYALYCYDQLCKLVSVHNLTSVLYPLCSVLCTDYHWSPENCCAFLVWNVMRLGNNIQANRVVMELLTTVCFVFTCMYVTI